VFIFPKFPEFHFLFPLCSKVVDDLIIQTDRNASDVEVERIVSQKVRRRR
jgi:hypothetical protein